MSKSTVSLRLILIASSVLLIPSLVHSLIFFLCVFLSIILILSQSDFSLSPSRPLPSFLWSPHQSLRKVMSWVSRMMGARTGWVWTLLINPHKPLDKEKPLFGSGHARVRGY